MVLICLRTRTPTPHTKASSSASSERRVTKSSIKGWDTVQTGREEDSLVRAKQPGRGNKGKTLNIGR